MTYRTEVLKSSRAVYMRHTGPYGSLENFNMMIEFKSWMAKNKLQDDLGTFGILGIALDNPQETSPEACRYDLVLCVSNQQTFNSSTEVKTTQFEGGTYAVFTIPHTTESVQQFWQGLSDIIAQNQLHLLDKPIIERFKEEEGIDNYCEFLLPVR